MADHCIHFEAADQIGEILGEFDVSEQVHTLLLALADVIGSVEPQSRSDFRVHVAAEVARTLEATREIDLEEFKQDLRRRTQQGKEKRTATKLEVVKH